MFHIIVVRLQKGVIMAKKTLDSQIKAVRKYESEREVLRVVVPKGTKGRISGYGFSYNAFVNEAIRRYLAYLEPAKPVEEKQQFVLKDGRIARTPEEMNEWLREKQEEDTKKLEEEKYNEFTQEEYRDLTKTKEKFETNL